MGNAKPVTTPLSDTDKYGRIRCAIYARYSSSNQNPVTIIDQIREARKFAAKNDFEIVDEHIYIDEDKTGTTAFNRDGLDALVAAIKCRPRCIDRVIVVDVSRLARNKADGHRLVDIFKFNQVLITFIEDGLDSGEGSFDEAYNSKLSQASNYSQSLGMKVKRGREGRFIDGYNPGVSCYGYFDVPDEDFSRKGDYGRPAVKGVIQRIDPEEAPIVVRIWEEYADGASYLGIAKKLNSERIPTSRPSRSRKERSWGKSTIQTILENPRYIGQVTWGKTVEAMDPETGQKVRRPTPAHEWLTQDKPELRIISDELWSRVAKRLAANRAIGTQRLGGMTRTHNSRKYLFSGWLRCGECGGNMTIMGSAPARYGCSTRNKNGNCSNKATILLKILEDAFLANLSFSLQSHEVRQELVSGLLAFLNTEQARTNLDQVTVDKEVDAMQTAIVALRLEEHNLIRAVATAGHSRALLASLEETEARIGRLQERVDEAVHKPIRAKVSEREVRDFIDERSKSMLEILQAEPEALRSFLHLHMSPIVLTPSVGQFGVIYSASGEIGDFRSTKHPMQNNRVDPIGLQWKIPVRFQVHPKLRQERRIFLDAA